MIKVYQNDLFGNKIYLTSFEGKINEEKIEKCKICGIRIDNRRDKCICGAKKNDLS